MIVELSAENVAILDRATLSLGPGFTVLTGETGAGKSLLVDAIELALGARGDSDLVRSGASKASVALTVDLSGAPGAVERAKQLGIEAEDDAMFIQREVFAEGRSQVRIQGKLAPVATLKALGQLLVDLHGQHDHQGLLHPDRHAGYLDAWIGPPAELAIANVAACWQESSARERRLAMLRTGKREREQRADLLRFQIQEIESVGPTTGESENLEARAIRLRHAEKLSGLAEEALQLTTRMEGSAYERLGAAEKLLQEVETLDSLAAASAKPIQEALYLLEEGSEALRQYAESIEADPAQLEAVSERMEALKRLRRKYGDDEAAVLSHLESCREELALLEEDSEGEEALALALEEAQKALESACGQLTALRLQGARAFSEGVAAELRELAMDKARFETRVEPRPADAAGADAIEFFFSANAGEPVRPLAKIASGGEVSRLMLAIKTVLAGKIGVPTLIFDEVEAGLGGPTAAVVGKKLEALASHYQVIVISHLPQIAGRAHVHYRIEKGETDGRVTTRVHRLSETERIEEIARMISGESVGDTARAHAADMLAGSI